MAIDREATLKKAEKLLRQGKIDGAIEEYVRLVEAQPRDWNSINALGDLYVRAGDADRAVAQFTRVADYLFQEGFFPKAAALYKKALKVKSDDEHTLLQLAEIAVRQGLLADAKLYFRQLAGQRKFRGDQRGAAECLIRLGSLDEADPESRIAAARAAQQLGDTAQAASLLKMAADDLERQNRRSEALDVLVDAAQLDPADLALRTRLARECVKAGNLERARLFLTAESAGNDPDLLFALGQIELASDKEQHARAIFTRLLTIVPERRGDVLRVAEAQARAGHVESAFGCVDVIADAALMGGEAEQAVGALQAFVREAPRHLPALSKLVELCVDAGLEGPLRDAQGQLADAYLEAGKATEARFIAEDLLERDPASDLHVTRLRRALELLGVPNPDELIAQHLHPTPPVTDLFDPAEALPDTPIEMPLDVSIDVSLDAPIEWPLDTAAAPSTADAPLVSAPLHLPDEDAIVIGGLEIDLSDALAQMGGVAPAPPPSKLEPEPGPPRDLESVFEDMRTRVSREQQATDATAQYDSGLAHLRDGRLEEAIADLQTAARVPLLRFRAAAQLGRLHIGRGELKAGVDWLERAAEAPAPTPDEGFALLYELADTLERMGESARALAILLELDADAGGYRDARSRIDRLSRVQTGSHGA